MNCEIPHQVHRKTAALVKWSVDRPRSRYHPIDSENARSPRATAARRPSKRVTGEGRGGSERRPMTRGRGGGKEGEKKWDSESRRDSAAASAPAAADQRHAMPYSGERREG